MIPTQTLGAVTSFWGPLWHRHQRKIRWVVIAFVAYVVTGFVLLPPVVKWVAIRQLTQLLDRPVTIASLRLNPFVFSITVRGFLVRDPDGEPLLSWDEVYLNAQPTSVFAKAWAVKELRTSQPFVRVQMNPDRRLTFADLVDKFSRTNASVGPAPAAALPSLRIDRLEIRGARAAVVDLTTRTPFRRMLGPVEIKLQDFRTHPENRNPYAFTGTTDVGERFSWSGSFYLSPIRSEGEFAVENLELRHYAALYQELVNFDLEQGVVDVRSGYRVVISESAHQASVTNLTIGLRGLTVKDRATGESVAALPEFRMTGGAVDVGRRSLQVDTLAVTGGWAHVRRAKDTSINLLELSQPAAAATNFSGSVQLLLQSVTNVFALLLSSTNQWQATVRDLQVREARIQLEDQVHSRPVNLWVDDIEVTVRNLSNVAGTNLSGEIALRWNTNGSVHTTVAATLDPLRAEVALKLDRVEIEALDAYLEPFVDVLILRSRLGLDARIQVESGGTNPLPSVRLTGDLALEDLGAAEVRTGADLIRWKVLRFAGLEAQLEPPSCSARELIVDDLVAQVTVETNGAINLLSAARWGPIVEGESAEAPLAAGKELGVVEKESGLFIPTNALPRELPLTAFIGVVAFTNASVQFTDRSVVPGADIAIRQVSGVLRGLSSRPEDLTELELRGQVENSGSVQVHGRLYPRALGQETSVEVSVSGVDLHPTGPYVGRFLGYRLSKGRLGAELKYEVRDGQVKGANLIQLDQFTLGEKVDSPDALSLPMKLGLAILKDRNGRIDLDVPVEGSLSDPEFRLGRVIARAIVNVLTKIVTSPFAALGAALGGGGEELSYQEFAPGADELEAVGRAKLDKLVTGLVERPGLQLEIEGAVDAVRDGAALRRRKLEAELQRSKWEALGKSARAETTPDRVIVSPQEFARFLEKKHRVLFAPAAVAARGGLTNAAAAPRVTPPFGRPPPGAGARAPAKGAERLGRGSPARLTKPEAQELEQQVMDLTPLTDDDYARLALRRAKRVRDYLLESGRVTADRLLLTEAGAVAKASRGSRVLLRLQ